MAALIEVLSPAGERRGPSVRPARALPSLAGKIAGLLDNDKSNTAAFLALVRRDLLACHGVRDVVVVRKGSAGLPAEAEALAGLGSCDFAITAFAD